jgi:hypothetical protein
VGDVETGLDFGDGAVVDFDFSGFVEEQNALGDAAAAGDEDAAGG